MENTKRKESKPEQGATSQDQMPKITQAISDLNRLAGAVLDTFATFSTPVPAGESQYHLTRTRVAEDTVTAIPSAVEPNLILLFDKEWRYMGAVHPKFFTSQGLAVPIVEAHGHKIEPPDSEPALASKSNRQGS